MTQTDLVVLVRGHGNESGLWESEGPSRRERIDAGLTQQVNSWLVELHRVQHGLLTHAYNLSVTWSAAHT